MQARKRSIFERIVSGTLALSLACSGPLFNVSAAAAASPTPPETSISATASQPTSPTVVRELTEKRTETSRSLLLSNGVIRAEYHSIPIHYRDAATNSMKPIDVTLQDTTVDGRPVAVNRANGFKLKLPRDLEDDEVSIETSKTSVSLRPRWKNRIGAAKVTTGAVESRSVSATDRVYPDAFVGAALEYESRADGLKETIVLARPIKENVFGFDLTLNGLTPRIEEDGSVSLSSQTATEPVFTIPAPFMMDSSRSTVGDDYSGAVRYELSGSGPLYYLAVVADAAWLADPARVYPVRIDPTIRTQTGGNDTFISSKNQATSYIAHTLIWLNKNNPAANWTEYGYVQPHMDLIDSLAAMKSDGMAVVESTYTASVDTGYLEVPGTVYGRMCDPTKDLYLPSLTWTKYAAGAGGVSALYPAPNVTVTSGGSKRFDVTSMMAYWQAAGTSQQRSTMRLAVSTGAHIGFNAADSTKKPTWSITYAPIPAVTLNSPSNGPISTIPSARWAFDSRGGGPQAEWQLEVATSTAGAAVASTGSSSAEGSASLPAPPGGWVAGTTYTVRLRVASAPNSNVPRLWSGWVSRSFTPVTPGSIASIDSSVTGLGWLTQEDVDDDGVADEPADAGDAGRVAIDLSWSASVGAEGYVVQLSDGNAFREVGRLAGNASTHWSSRDVHFYPGDSAISAIPAGSAGNPFLPGTGCELRDSPTALYRRTSSVLDDRNYYEFRIVPISEAGEGGSKTVRVTPPLQTVQADAIPVIAAASAAPKGKAARPVLVFLPGFLNRQKEYGGDDIANDEAQGYNKYDLTRYTDDGTWSPMIGALEHDYDIIKFPIQYNSTDPLVGTPTGDIRKNGDVLYSYLSKHPKLQDGKRKYIIVSYSMGGLVARAMLDGTMATKKRAKMRSRCARVIQVGTPNGGTIYLRKLAKALRIICKNAWYDKYVKAELQMRPDAMKAGFNKKYKNPEVKFDGESYSRVRYYDKIAGRAKKRLKFFSKEYELGGDRVVEATSVWGPGFLTKYGSETLWYYGVHTEEHEGGYLPPWVAASKSTSIVPRAGTPLGNAFAQSLVKKIDYAAGFARENPIVLASPAPTGEDTAGDVWSPEFDVASTEITSTDFSRNEGVTLQLPLTGAVLIESSPSDADVTVQEIGDTGAVHLESSSTTESVVDELGNQINITEKSTLAEIEHAGEYVISVTGGSEATGTVVIQQAVESAPRLAGSVDRRYVRPGESFLVTAAVVSTSGPVSAGWSLAVGSGLDALRDDGLQGDLMAGDGVWSTEATAPDSEGEFDLPLSARPASSETTLAALSGAVSIYVAPDDLHLVAVSRPTTSVVGSNGLIESVAIDVEVTNDSPHPQEVEATVDLGVAEGVSICTASESATIPASASGLVRIEVPSSSIYPGIRNGGTLVVKGARISSMRETEFVTVDETPTGATQSSDIEGIQLQYRECAFTTTVERDIVTVEGSAFTNGGKLSAVEVSVDDGETWLPAYPLAGSFDSPQEQFVSKLRLPEGSYEVSVRPREAAGLWAPVDWSTSPVLVDLTAPQAEWSLYASAEGSASILVAADDPTVADLPSGVDHFDLIVDGVSRDSAIVFDANQAEYNLAIDGVGDHEFQIRAVDKTGNQGAWLSGEVHVE